MRALKKEKKGEKTGSHKVQISRYKGGGGGTEKHPPKKGKGGMKRFLIGEEKTLTRQRHRIGLGVQGGLFQTEKQKTPDP